MQRTWDNREDPAWKNAARLYFHCFIKGVQLGSVLGVAVMTPIFVFRNRGKPFEIQRLMKYQLYSILCGCTISLGMCTAKVISWENRPQKFQDRAYRIYYNEGQNRVDYFTYIGMGIASPIGLLSGGFVPMIGFGSYGVVAALIANLATKKNKQE